MQELQRVRGRLILAEQQHRTELFVARSDRHFGDHARGHGGSARA
jgi:hypothetical protein